MARPTKLTPALLTKLDAIADTGRSLTSVCEALDIDPDTFRTWEALDPVDERVSRFHGMAARVRARANDGRRDQLDKVLEAALADPDVAPSKKAEIAIQWHRLLGVNRVELTGRDGGAIEVSADARGRLEDLLKRSAGGDDA